MNLEENIQTTMKHHDNHPNTCQPSRIADLGRVRGMDEVDNVGLDMSNQSQRSGKLFLTLREAADYANCSTQTIRRAVHGKALAHHRIGSSETHGKIFIRITDLESYLLTCRFEAAQ
jgi:excisionase family DNA binding protein